MSTSLQNKAASIEANDHAVIPCQSNGNPQPYGNEQRYPSYMVRKDGYSGIPHPQTKSVNKGKLPEESIEHWATRFHSWMAAV